MGLVTLHLFKPKRKLTMVGRGIVTALAGSGTVGGGATGDVAGLHEHEIASGVVVDLGPVVEGKRKKLRRHSRERGAVEWVGRV
jgi:hypothetical protein